MMGATSHTAPDEHEGSDATASGYAADDAEYAAALATLLRHAVRSPGLLDRVWFALRALHARRRDDGEPLPPEHWFWSM